MAEIKMDMTEYTSIMENKKLLEEALEREKELNKEIQKLKEEKIQVLENNSKKVSVVTTKKSEQVVRTAHDAKEVFKQILYDLGASSRSMSQLDFIGVDFNKYIDRLFTTSIVENVEDKQIVYKGLDEVEQIIEGKLRAEYLNKIENADAILKREVLWRREEESKRLEVNSLRASVKELESENKSLKDEIKTLKEKVNDTSKLNELENKIEKLKKVTKGGCGLFGVGEYTRKINDILHDDDRTKK